MKTIANYKLTLICALAIATSGLMMAQDPPQLSDPEIASVAVVANQIDINYGKIALERSKNKDVIDFAYRMIEDHKAVINQAVALVTKLGVTPMDNAVSQSLLTQSKETLKKLNSVSKKDFDKTYIDNEVAYHEAVISAVKDVLIVQAKNAELKDLLEAVLPALEAHLGHAKMAQSKISK